MFIITHNGPSGNVQFSRMTGEEADLFEAALVDGQKSYRIGKSFDLSAVPSKVLVEVHNRITGSSITKFQDRAIAYTRVWKDLKSLPEDGAGEPAPAPAKPSAQLRAALDAKPTLEKPAPKRAYRKLDPNAVIRVLVDENPKRPGTDAHRLFELYRDGMTVQEFLDAGGSSAYLTWDAFRSGHGYISVEEENG